MTREEMKGKICPFLSPKIIILGCEHTPIFHKCLMEDCICFYHPFQKEDDCDCTRCSIEGD